MADFLPLKSFLEPQVLVAEKDFLIAFKPPRMHSAPLADSSDNTILEWCSREYPEVLDLNDKKDLSDNDAQTEIPGRSIEEGGLLHRLDYETHGLLLIARTLSGMENLLEQQKERKIIKEYSALAGDNKIVLQGFPGEKPDLPFWIFREKHRIGDSVNIKSAFRPYGPERKVVRPLLPVYQGFYMKVIKQGHDVALDGYRPYLTDIIGAKVLSVSIDTPEAEIPGMASFQIRILRGFRHQIRCHFAWAGWPILNDELYEGYHFGKGYLALRACALTFTDPSSGKELSYSIRPLTSDDI